MIPKAPISQPFQNPFFACMKHEENQYFTATLYKTQKGYKLCEVWLHLG